MDPAALLARAERRSIALSDLLVDPDVSCRNRIHDGRIRLMAEAVRTGNDLEPLVVAIVDGAVTLIDGHHRYQALLEVERGRTEVLVLSDVSTRADARWLAFWLHWRAALPLTRKERREGFRAYVGAGHHLATRFGRIKTYRAIAADLGLPKTTLWNWMRVEFPSIAAKMAKEETEVSQEAKQDAVRRRALRVVRHHADQLALLAREGSQVADEAQKALVAALRRAGDQRPLEAILEASEDEYNF